MGRGYLPGPPSSILVAVRIRDSNRGPFCEVVGKEETWFCLVESNSTFNKHDHVACLSLNQLEPKCRDSSIIPKLSQAQRKPSF